MKRRLAIKTISLASKTGGSYFSAPTASALLEAFGNVIPGELNALPPAEVLVFSFTNPIEAPLGKSVKVPRNLFLTYENANNLHQVKTKAVYGCLHSLEKEQTTPCALQHS